jgi:hypothetical protein
MSAELILNFAAAAVGLGIVTTDARRNSSSRFVRER